MVSKFFDKDFQTRHMGHQLLRPHRRPRTCHPARPNPLRAGPPPRRGLVLCPPTRPPRTQTAPHRQPSLARVTFIHTTGDRFVNSLEINDLFEQESPIGQLHVRLKELGIVVEREWWIDDEGNTYVLDLALPVVASWLSVTFGERLGPSEGLRFTPDAEPEVCLREVQARLHAS